MSKPNNQEKEVSHMETSKKNKDKEKKSQKKPKGRKALPIEKQR